MVEEYQLTFEGALELKQPQYAILTEDDLFRWYPHLKWSKDGEDVYSDRALVATHIHKGRHKRNPPDDEFEDFDLEAEMDSGVVISDAGRRGGYDVSAEGKYIGKATEWDDAVRIATKWMNKNKYWPNLFYVNDHGNVDLLDHKGNIVKSWV